MAITPISLSPALVGDTRPNQRAAVAEVTQFQKALGAATARTDAPGASVGAVKPSRTQLSGEQAAEAISRAFEKTTGHAPSKATLAILTSHWSLETGQGAQMYNFNFAGIKGRSPEGLTAVMNTREGYGDTEVHIKDGFRAYSTAESGASDYIGLLTRKYGAAVDAAVAEDPSRFATELKQGGYYTGNEALYAQGITRLANRAMSLGLDAIGANPGALSAVPESVERYFAPPSLDGSGNGASGFAAFAGLPRGAGGSPSVFSSGAMADELTRVALRIAAEHGVGRDNA